MERLGLDYHEKAIPLEMRVADGVMTSYGGGQILMETPPLPVVIEGRKFEVSFDIAPSGSTDAILGWPWLLTTKPQFDYENERLVWPDGLTMEVETPMCEVTMEVLQILTEEIPKEVVEVMRIQAKPGWAPLQEGMGMDPLDTKDRLKAVPKEFRCYLKVFREEQELGLPPRSRWDHEIKLKPGTQPGCFKVYPMNEKEKEILWDYLQKNLKMGKIQRSESEAGYPIFFVRKKLGGRRPCVDYRQLNDITYKNRYPLPLISTFKDKLYGKKWFTVLDLKAAYHTIRIKEGDEWKTAFRTQFGLFEYLVMPFGLTNAPATLQELVNTLLREYLDQSVEVYMDDILIYSEPQRVTETRGSKPHHCARKVPMDIPTSQILGIHDRTRNLENGPRQGPGSGRMAHARKTQRR